MVKKKSPPKYEILKEQLLAEITRGAFQSGDLFYTEKEIMSKYKLSYATVTHAIRDMVADDIFIRIKGKGTFIKEQTQPPAPEETIVTTPLFINGIPAEDHKKETPLSWIVWDDIQKGIINKYPGKVQIVSCAEITKQVTQGREMNVILVSPDLDTLNFITKSKLNYIVINYRRDFYLEKNTVTWQMLSGVYELISYLIRALGHTRIGFIGGATQAYHADRYAAYAIALKAHQIKLDEKLVIRNLFGYFDDGYQAMKTLLAQPDRPTAVFADTDIKALGAIQAARDEGLRVPEDISVAGFDDIPEAATHSPPLTSVKTPCDTIGTRAVELLLERIKTNADIPSETLSGYPIIRQSCQQCKHDKQKKNTTSTLPLNHG